MKRPITSPTDTGADHRLVRWFESLDGLSVREPDVAETAHLLRRLTVAPGPGSARQALEAHGSPGAVLDALLAAGPRPFDPPGDLDAGFDDVPDALDDGDRMVMWWLKRMTAPEAGLHDRMMWCWHGLFTTSTNKAPTLACWRQLRTLHQHALGNFGELLRAMLDDVAMFVYLDADGSQRSAPNENLSRELLELFTLGIGNYSQTDVAAGAHLLAGRRLDWEAGQIMVDDDQPRARRQDYLGVPDVRDLDGMTAAILEHDACAAHVVRWLWDHFLGSEPDQARVDEWADQLRSSSYEIAPLIATMVGSDEFRAARLARPRSGLEWFLTSVAILEHDDWSIWDLNNTGQLPYRPPNVAGWPGRSRWTSATSMLGRGSWITWFAPPVVERLLREGVADNGGEALVDAVLERCGVFELTERTRRALDTLAAELLPFEPDGDSTPALTAVLRATLLTPEFSLA